jgi:hypothetical protein
MSFRVHDDRSKIARIQHPETLNLIGFPGNVLS